MRYLGHSDTADKYVVQSIYTNLSDLYLAKKDCQSTVNTLEKGLGRLPNRPEMYRKKAVDHLSAGDKNKAIQTPGGFRLMRMGERSPSVAERRTSSLYMKKEPKA
ncbi:MAG: hypothetical protein A2W17_11240 [Planctomycetes bacterium RBG_16_41_13]|nr:MAG: hypothetical protein A2W17_11240 [Planctomycetes bacterium RBG_16_41_13]